VLVLVASGAIPIHIESIGGLHAGCRRRVHDDARRRRVDRARKAHFSTTGVRYILTAAVLAHARGGLPASPEALPIPLRRRLPRLAARDGPALVAVDVAAVAARAEEERPSAVRHRALNESNRVHAAMATAGNFIAQAGACGSFRTSHVARRRDDGLGAPTPGPTLLPSARSSTAANYPARSDSRGLTRSPTVYVTGGHSPDLMIKANVSYRIVKDQAARATTRITEGSLSPFPFRLRPLPSSAAPDKSSGSGCTRKRSDEYDPPGTGSAGRKAAPNHADMCMPLKRRRYR
jgi:hypothetical protein